MSSRRHFLEPLLEPERAGRVLMNTRTGVMVASQIELAADSRSRNRGLLGRSSLPVEAVMIIAPCNAIHTCFMRFTIDAVFVNRSGVVLKAFRDVRPWRVRASRKAFAVLEMAAGAVSRLDISVGDKLQIDEKP